jgi:hypothetical protein
MLAAVAAVIVFVAVALNQLGVLERPHVNGGLADQEATATVPALGVGTTPTLPTTRPTAAGTVPPTSPITITESSPKPTSTTSRPPPTTTPPTTGTATTAAPSSPVFTASTPLAAATVGAPYRYIFKASGQPPPSFTVASGTLPAGLSLDSATGVLSGSPTAPGTSTFTVAASNGIGTPAQTGTITITAS